MKILCHFRQLIFLFRVHLYIPAQLTGFYQDIDGFLYWSILWCAHTLVSEMTNYVSSGTLNSTNSHPCCQPSYTKQRQVLAEEEEELAKFYAYFKKFSEKKTSWPFNSSHGLFWDKLSYGHHVMNWLCMVYYVMYSDVQNTIFKIVFYFENTK